ncbi:hypothetical protein RUM44_006853 [Polyplax serrata]|uniref:Uncharacterized protein n=1 Tax=Polyplax serrata TaxID=468196 RepID=A0ABR1AJH2_POLSC
MLILQQTVDEEFDLLELLKMMEGQLQGMFPTKMEIVEHLYKTILPPSLANIFQLISYQEVKKLDNKGMPLLLNKSTLKQGQRGMDTKNQKVLITYSSSFGKLMYAHTNNDTNARNITDTVIKADLALPEFELYVAVIFFDTEKICDINVEFTHVWRARKPHLAAWIYMRSQPDGSDPAVGIRDQRTL